MNPIRREVNEFLDHLRNIGLRGGLPIVEDYSPSLQVFTYCITYLGNKLPRREDPDPNINFGVVSKLQEEIYIDYKHI